MLKVPEVGEDEKLAADVKSEPGNKDNERNLDAIDRIAIVLNVP